MPLLPTFGGTNKFVYIRLYIPGSTAEPGFSFRGFLSFKEMLKPISGLGKWSNGSYFDADTTLINEKYSGPAI